MVVRVKWPFCVHILQLVCAVPKRTELYHIARWKTELFVSLFKVYFVPSLPALLMPTQHEGQDHTHTLVHTTHLYTGGRQTAGHRWRKQFPHNVDALHDVFDQSGLFCILLIKNEIYNFLKFIFDIFPSKPPILYINRPPKIISLRTVT